jgi:lipopolysaccharide transport system permease protein/teichoic acid transport system permease protein
MLKPLYHFLKMLVERRGLIWEMAKRDIVQKYAGSWLGLVWSIINPMVIITIFWFVFGLGLKSRPVADVPFVVYFTSGLAIWFAFSEIVAESTTMITDNRHLVDKILFPTHILPVVKVVSCFLNHLIFVALVLVLMMVHSITPSLWMIQFVYYYLAMVALAIGLSWITSAVNVFVRDIGQVVQLVLQIGFWTTPILWDPSIFPPVVQDVLKFNPMYYIVQGYRDSFFAGVGFWEHWKLSSYYWAVAVVIFLVGALIFKRLKPHFADVV